MHEMTPFVAKPPETLVDVLDRLLDTGAVIDGNLVLSVAGVDLVFVGLRALVASVDSAARLMAPAPGHTLSCLKSSCPKSS